MRFHALLIDADYTCIVYYRKTSNKRPPAFNRDPAFIGDSASIRTMASSPLRLLMPFVPVFPVLFNFTLHVNSEHLCLLD